MAQFFSWKIEHGIFIDNTDFGRPQHAQKTKFSVTYKLHCEETAVSKFVNR